MEGTEEDKKFKTKFIKSKVNKVEESYRSPLSQEFYPNQVSNYFTPMNVTKVEKNLNKLLSEYCLQLYQTSFITSVFFSDFNTSHLVHLVIRREMEEDDYFKGGFYQVRVMIEISTKFVIRSGFLEYQLLIEDVDKSTRHIEGTLIMPDEHKTTSERQLDIKNFNYKEIGAIFSKTESYFYQTLVNIIFKMRPTLNEETKRSAEERESAPANRIIINQMMNEFVTKQRSSKPASKVLQAFGLVAMGNKNKVPPRS